MSRRAHHHLAWESQPLLRPAPRPRQFSARAVVVVSIAAFLLGLCF